MRERKPGRLTNRHHVPASGYLHQRLLCVAQTYVVAGAQADAVLLSQIQEVHSAVLNWGPQRLAARIIDAHPRRFADPQDDSIFHPRTWHRAARLGQVSFQPPARLRGWS